MALFSRRAVCVRRPRTTLLEEENIRKLELIDGQALKAIAHI